MSYSELDLTILKAITTDKKRALDFVNTCSPNLLSNDVWNFTNLVIGYIRTYRDVPTLKILVEKVSKTNPTFAETINTIWDKLEKHTYNDKEFPFNVEKLKQRFADNEINKLKNALDVEANSSKAITNIEKTISNIKALTTAKTYERKTLKDSIEQFKDELTAKVSDPNFDSGILTGYSFIDQTTDGLRSGELLLIGGESGSGKSTLLANMAVQMWMQNNTLDMSSNFNKGYNVLYFSLEMPFKVCRNRVMSRLSGVPTKIIRRPITKNGKLQLSSEYRVQLSKAMRFVNNYPYTFEIVDIPRGATAEGIEVLVEESVVKYNPDIIAIDYLGLMDDDGKEEDWLKLGMIAGKCHELCRVHNLIGLSAVQLNRTKSSSKETEDKVGLHRIGRSSLILTHANIGIQIETRQNETKYPDMICHIIKNRDGENMVKGRLLKNLAAATLLDDGSTTTENENKETEFYDVDDISGDVELFDI